MKEIKKQLSSMHKLLIKDHEQILKNTESIKWFQKLSGIIIAIIIVFLEIIRIWGD